MATEKHPQIHQTLFAKVQELEPQLELSGVNVIGRNFVAKGVYAEKECFVKIGKKAELANLQSFYNSQVQPQNFTEDDQNYLYFVEEVAEGQSLQESRQFTAFNEKVVDIVLEIDKLSNLELSRTQTHQNYFQDRQTREQYKQELSQRLNHWYEISELKMPEILEKGLGLLDEIFENETYEYGTIHGEFNFGHIYLDSEGHVPIIDWERASEHGFRFFDLAEYVARLIVSVESGMEMAGDILEEFREKVPEYSATNFKFCLYYRIIGTLAEMKVTGDMCYVRSADQEKLIQLIRDNLG